MEVEVSLERFLFRFEVFGPVKMRQFQHHIDKGSGQWNPFDKSRVTTQTHIINLQCKANITAQGWAEG